LHCCLLFPQQHTTLDVPPLLLAPRDRREPFGKLRAGSFGPAQGKPFLLSNLPLGTPDGQDVRWWWSRWYEPLRSSLQQDVISPVLTKVFRLSGNSSSRSVFGQAVSTLNLRQVLRQGGILLVHTATGELGEEIGGTFSFSGGAVILNLLNVVIRERTSEARARRCFHFLACLVIVDEFQSIFVHLFIVHCSFSRGRVQPPGSRCPGAGLPAGCGAER